MSFYHVYIVLKDSKHLYEKDDSEEDTKVISNNYNEGKRFLFCGRWLDRDKIEEIRIYKTGKPSSEYPTNVFYMQDKEDTRNWIKRPPQKALEERDKKAKKVFSNDVFIVHGRDYKPVKELKTILKKLGLTPIVLHEQPSRGRTVVEKLEKYSDVGYAFIILTPDDIGASRYLGRSDLAILGNQELVENAVISKEMRFKGPFSWKKGFMILFPSFMKMRARQNVVLEFGFFMGLLGRDRVCCLYKGDIELPSDMHGIVPIPFEESVNQAKDEIIKELEAADYKLKRGEAS
jgi:predicted nucleotide-binding protein